jgi:hypothetical protein
MMHGQYNIKKKKIIPLKTLFVSHTSMCSVQSQYITNVAAIVNCITIKVISPISGYALADHQI